MGQWRNRMKSHVGWALALAGAIAPSTAVAQATPLPYGEVWGNLVGGCGPQWAGQCEMGWQGHGGAGALAIKQSSNHPGLKALLIKPGTPNSPNGVSRLFSVTPGGNVDLDFEAVGVEGGAKLHLRVKYLNGAGAAVGTENEVFDVPSCSNRRFQVRLDVPNSAVTAQIFYGASNPTTPTTAIAVGGFWCLLCWLPSHIDPDPPPPPPPPPDDGQSCPQPQCDPCNISCDESEFLVSTCYNDSNCNVIQECYCDSVGECDDEFAVSTSWF